MIATTGVIRMELLRGAASSIHDELRTSFSAGDAVRNSIDCLIAATCIRTGTPLLHADADFDKLAAVSDLRVVAT